MRILTVVVNYRTGAFAARAVRAALEARPREHEMLTVVVDNASGDDSLEILRGAAEQESWGDRVVIVASQANGGFGAGNNLGVHTAMEAGYQPDLVYLLNPDAIPAQNAIDELVEYLQAHPHVGIVGSFIHGTDGEPHRTAFRFPSALGELEASAKTGPLSRLLARNITAPPIPTQSCEMDWVAGCSMMLRREVIESVGLFDETFFLYYEETDLCRRARDAGWVTAYVRDSHVAHEGSASTGMKERTRPMPPYWFDSRWYYLCKHHGAGYAAASTAAQLAGGLLWRARRRVQRSAASQPEPAHYLRDLGRHALLSLVRDNHHVRREPSLAQDA